MVHKLHVAILKLVQLSQETSVRVKALPACFYEFISLQTVRWKGPYLIKFNPKSLHYVHNYARCWPRPPHGAVDENHIAVVRPSVKCINCWIYLEGCSVHLHGLPFCRSVLLLVEIYLQCVKQNGCFPHYSLSLINIYLALEHVVHQGVVLGGTSIEKLLVVEGVLNELVNYWETDFDLHVILVFNANFKVLHLHGVYTGSTEGEILTQIFKMVGDHRRHIQDVSNA